MLASTSPCTFSSKIAIPNFNHPGNPGKTFLDYFNIRLCIAVIRILEGETSVKTGSGQKCLITHYNLIKEQAQVCLNPPVSAIFADYYQTKKTNMLLMMQPTIVVTHH